MNIVSKKFSQKFLRIGGIIATVAILVASPFGAVSIAAAPEGLPEQAISHMPVCPPSISAEFVHCHAHVVTNKNNTPSVTTAPSGYGPVQFKAAYNPGNAAGSPNKVIAIVDAYDNPTIFNDLAVYSSTFNIRQLSNCAVQTATTNPCFQKIDQRGGSSYPAVNSGWALEIALDVESAHAMCPDCSILLVEADSSSLENLLAAEDKAVSMGAAAVSNSWGANEFSLEINYDSHFNHPGVAFTVSSGDNGYGTEYPAASRYVTSVGGTTLNMSGNTYLGETVWSGSGSGCSVYESKPSFQKDSGCGKRMIADVSADADPGTGAAVYDTTPYGGQTGWFQVGGTSLAAPLVASIYALSGIPSGAQANSLPYLNPGALHDVTRGSNGHCKRFPNYFCNAGNGYDGPTGLGTPNGLSGF